MKKLFWIFSISLLTSHLPAQSNAPVQLALIAETDEASAASDILTAQLSGNQKIHLLERDEIGKIYHEQGMSAANRDDLKLGRILGADGLLLLDVVRTPQATNLTARLIAVKPGVILTDGSFPWPLKDTAQWAESVSTYLNSFLPKLSLLVKDAVPISVVNLRSAISSSEAGETERQLKLLTIQRLSREPQFFVLERQKMQLLGEEKELKTDDSAFWNGSYDLNHNGIIDPDEKEEALDDPAFIESELDAIDANHNGWLDAEELTYFDANKNKTLETKEQAGIDIALHLLALKLLKKFDVDGDGFIDRSEFNDLWHSHQKNNAPAMQGPIPNYLFPDKDQDELVDLGELETFLKQQTRGGLRSRRMPGTNSFSQMRMNTSQPIDPRQMFKAAVESYWQNPGGIPNGPLHNEQNP